MRTLAVINYKGGVGKTTLTLNIAAELAYSHQQRVLLIDLDPQASLTFAIVPVDVWRSELESKKTIKGWYDSFIRTGTECPLGEVLYSPPHLRFTEGSVDLIASHLGLINVDLELATKLGGASFSQMTHNYLRVFSRLRTGLAESQVQDKYDVVLIDCPPNFNIVTKTALVSSDAYLVPAKPDYLSTLGIDQLQTHVRHLTEDYNRFQREQGPEDYRPINPAMLGVVFTMVRYYNKEPIQDQKEYIAAIQRQGHPILTHMVRENNRFYARRTDGTLPLVLQQTSETGFLEIRTELEELTAEVQGRLASL